MKIRTKKHNHLYWINPWPSVGVPVGGGWDKARAQFLRALKKYRKNNPYCNWCVWQIDYQYYPCYCYAVRKSASREFFQYWDGTEKNLGYHVDDEKLFEYIDEGGYFIFGEVGEKIGDVIDYINKREDCYVTRRFGI